MPTRNQEDQPTNAAADVTVVMHTYNRPDYFEHYVRRGLWDQVPLLLVDDGSPEGVVERLRIAADGVGGTVHHYAPNQGVAVATATGVSLIDTPNFMLVGDDDYFVDYHAFAHDAAQVLAEDEQVLMVLMPRVFYMQAGTGDTSLKYDRVGLNGITGRHLLQRFVQDGELYVLQAGAMMRRADVEPALADPFFRVSEDYTMLCRLCAQHPDRTIRVLNEGGYVRLMHDASLSARSAEQHQHYMIHLVSLCVGAHLLIEQGRLSHDAFVDLLRQRGQRLYENTGFGPEAVEVLIAMLAGAPLSLRSAEAVQMATFLHEQKKALPYEFKALMPVASLQTLATPAIDQAQLIEDAPVEAAPVEAAPVEAAPVEAAPVEATLVEANPVQANPVQANPVQANPVQANPVEADPVEADPVQADPVQANPVEAGPVVAAPAWPGDITLIMPTYNRVEHLARFAAEGYWAGVPLQIIDDGSDAPVAERLAALAAEHGFAVNHLAQNVGVSQAVSEGIRQAATPYVAVVGDDDYLVDAGGFAVAARQIWQDHDDVLLVAMPYMYSVGKGETRLQYDRREWAGLTGRALLNILAKEGEMKAMGAGVVFERQMLEDVLPDAFFRMAGDFAMLARLCARYPDRKVYLAESGSYMRLMHAGSITARPSSSTDKVVMHLMSILVGASHLAALGEISPRAIGRLLLRRGQILQITYQRGRGAAALLNALLDGAAPKADTDEQAEALAFLHRQVASLPAECRQHLPPESLALLQNPGPALQPTTPVSPAADPVRQVVTADDPDLERLTSISNIVDEVQAGRFDAAAACIVAHKAHHEHDDDLATLEAVVALGQSDIMKAVRALTDALVRSPEHFGHLFMLGNVLMHGGAYEDAARVYTRAYRQATTAEQAQFEPVWAQLGANGIDGPVPSQRLAFIVKPGMDQFLGDIMSDLMIDHEVRKFVYQGTATVDEALQWADVCWFEWCNEPLLYASRHPMAHNKKLICRLHRYETFTAVPMQVRWTAVDRLVFVTGHLEKMLAQIVPGLRDMVTTEVIQNGVKLDDYTWAEHQPGFKIACVGYLHLRKNPMMMLQILARLVAIDPRYQLHVAGVFQDPLARLYWGHTVREMGLEGHVHLEGWQADMNAWLQDKDYILSTSIHESFGYAIAEAMACGLKPVVHHFPFATEIWAEEMLFMTVDEAAAQITDAAYDSAVYRRFIERRYTLEQQTNKIRRMLTALQVVPADEAPPLAPLPPAPPPPAPPPVAPPQASKPPPVATPPAAAPATAETDTLEQASLQLLRRSAERLQPSKVA